MNLESPRAALESLERAAAARDWDAFTSCIAPKYVNSYRKIIGVSVPVRDAAERVADAAEQKFGAEPVEPIREALGFMDVPTPLACVMVDGQIDWEQVSLSVDGEVAAVEIDDYPVAVVARTDGMWRVTPHDVAGEDPAELDAQMEAKAEGAAQMVADLGALADQVARGEVQLEDLLPRFGEIM